MPTLRSAAALALELRAIAAYVPRVRAVATPPSERRDWIVTATTPQIPVTLSVLQRWEEELLAIAQRSPGCRFLGWRTRASSATSGHSDASLSRAAPQEGGAPSQRQLVIASLLRHPVSDHEASAQRRAASR